MRKLELAAVLRRSGSASPAQSVPGLPPEDTLEWSWPPYAPVVTDDEPFDTAEWAPSSVVWHPQVRLGRWTLVYRRC